MSRLAKNDIIIPVGVSVAQKDSQLVTKGTKGVEELEIHHAIIVTVTDKTIKVALKDGCKEYRAMLGTTFRNIANMLIGVSQGFEKKLSLVGVGYRAKMQGSSLELTLGYSHPVVHQVPKGIAISVDGNTTVRVFGSSKQQVGQVAADIRSYRPPEPYKGKGVRYVDEEIRRKEVKKKQ